MKSGYYHHAIGDLRKRLSAAVPNEVLKALHRKSPARHFAVVLRQARPLRGRVRALVAVREPLGPDPVRARPRLRRLRRDRPPSRGRPQGRLRRRPARRLPRARPPLRAAVGDLADAVHALAPRPPRRARLLDGRPEARAPVAEEERPLAEAPLRDAGALPDLLPRRAEGDRDLPRDAPPPHRGRAPRRDPPPPRDGRRDRAVRRRRAPRLALRRPGLPRLPARLRAEPPRPALRHRARRAREVGHAHGALAALGVRLPLVEPPPRAPLLPRRPVLPAAGAQHGARPLLREGGRSGAPLPRPPPRLDRREPCAAFGLERAGRSGRRRAA